jgi:hypothetical protein
MLVQRVVDWRAVNRLARLLTAAKHMVGSA